VPDSSFPTLGHVVTAATYRTEPALRTGAEIKTKMALLVGQRLQNDSPAAAILLGKICENTASKNFYNWSVWLDATFPHVGLIAGKRGSGKSYDLGIVAEGLCATGPTTIGFGTEKFALVLFDTQNQFWTLQSNKEDVDRTTAASLLAWKLGHPTISAPTVYRPSGTPKVAEFEFEFSIRPSDLESDDWTALCGLDRFSAMGQCLRQSRSAMKEEGFAIRDMISWLKSGTGQPQFTESTRDAVAWRLAAIDETQLFDSSAEDITSRLARPGSKTVIELGELDDDTKSVIVAVVMRKIHQRAGAALRRAKINQLGLKSVGQAQDVAPRIWVLIDEAHLLCPAGRATAATPVVVDYVKRGRDAGLSLIVATQQPSALENSIVSQCDLVVVHKLTTDPDIEAATARMPARAPTKVTKMPSVDNIADMGDLARALDSGQALVADAESNRAFLMQSRPRVTPHGGGEPPLDL